MACMCLSGFAEILSKNWVKVWVWIKGGLNLLSFKMQEKKRKNGIFKELVMGILISNLKELF